MKEQPRILIVDDDLSNIKILQHILEDSYRLIVATNGADALKLVSRKTPDMILLDIIMPEMDGFEVCRRLKKNKKHKNIPVLFITSKSDVEDEALGLKVGAVDYITKPINPPVVLARIRNHMLLKKQHDQLKRSITLSEKQLVDYARDLTELHKAKKKQQVELDLLLEKEKYRRNLEAVFESVNDALITIDPELNITEANRAAYDVCCLNPDKFLGNKITEKPASECRCLAILLQTMESGKLVHDYKVECSQKGCKDKTAILNTSILSDKNKNSMGGLLVIRDVTRLTNLEKQVEKQHKFHDIIGRNERMLEIFELLDNLSDTDTTVLIRGESGTGKEMVARALHYQGVRASKPIMTVNCSALAEELLESELFGHVKGSFTGATRD
ncbi:MAG: sigma 54-interacting transcriptional regulator, partial [Deltaproteobacteria bacterium]|nr:sigma 54-interacting transcriptional regulator [Deltaproteobacteria bacterium]